MEIQLITTISRDLNITKFNSETRPEFHNRLIYCVLAEWARTLVLGDSYNDIKKNEHDISINVDILHIQTHLEKIAYSFLSILDCSVEWLKGEHIHSVKKKITQKVIEDLINCEQLVKIHNSRRLTVPFTASINVFEYEYYSECLINNWNSKNIYRVGVGQWGIKKDSSQGYCSFFGVNEDETLYQYYYKLKQGAKWKDFDLDDEYELYDYEKTFLWAWKTYSSKKLCNGMNLLKKKDSNLCFLLINKIDDSIEVASLDLSYVVEGEIYRIMYAIKELRQFNIYFDVIEKDDHFILHCSSRLPNIEMSLLKLMSWPYKTYDDEKYRVIPKMLWGDCKFILERLGISFNLRSEI
ncbi:hypothetical protein [Turicibacter bilis]|uniref:hypothetical protein n=1 Tax=Turicibacter bilis TaxID=2735723 RepID=UPI003F886F44